MHGRSSRAGIGRLRPQTWCHRTMANEVTLGKWVDKKAQLALHGGGSSPRLVEDYERQVSPRLVPRGLLKADEVLEVERMGPCARNARVRSGSSSGLQEDLGAYSRGPTFVDAAGYL